MNSLIKRMQEFPKFFRKDGSVNAPHIYKKDDFLQSALYIDILDFIEDDIPINQKVLLILDHKDTVPKCLSCNSTLVFNKSAAKFKTYCSRKCMYSGNSRTSKISNTKLDNYGDENYNNRNKSIKTCLEKYKVNNFVESSEFKKKAKQTKLDRYGDQDYNNWEKTKYIMLEKYGVPFNSQRHYTDDVLNKLTKDYLIQQHHTLKKSQTEIASDIGVDLTTISNYLTKLSIEKKYYKYSTPEQQIANYIQENYNTEIIRNSRNIIPPKEIDIYLPKYKLAIEFNGIFWHRPEIYGGDSEWLEYHNSKEQQCKEQGLGLLHIWENYGDHNELIDEAIRGQINNNYNIIYTKLYNQNS